MNILAVDTAGKTAGVALLQDDRLLYEVYLDGGMTHSETLMPMIDTCLKMCGLTCADIDLYAVNAGPGSFTGLRIGLAAVKGLAFPRETLCAPVSTLEALAAAHTGGLARRIHGQNIHTVTPSMVILRVVSSRRSMFTRMGFSSASRSAKFSLHSAATTAP